MPIISSKSAGQSRCFPPEAPSPCLGQVIIKPPPDVPDPAIYSQGELLATGNLTFDNPDIIFDLDPTLVNGVWTFPDPRFLMAAKITVHNLSSKVSAINTLVQCSTTTFGIGFPRMPLGTQVASIPRDGHLDLAFVVPQRPASWQGTVLIVDISHPCDRRLSNNLGYHCVSSILTQAGSGRVQIPLWVMNDSPNRRTVDLSVLPNALNAAVSTESIDCLPESPYELAITLGQPANPPSRGEVTVVATIGGALIGGMTFKVFADAA